MPQVEDGMIVALRIAREERDAARDALEWIAGCFAPGKRKTYGDPDETMDRIREKAEAALKTR